MYHHGESRFNPVAEQTAHVEPTRFRGPLTLWEGSIHRGEIETAPRSHGGRLRWPSGARGSSRFAPDRLRKSGLVSSDPPPRRAATGSRRPSVTRTRAPMDRAAQSARRYVSFFVRTVVYVKNGSTTITTRAEPSSSSSRDGTTRIVVTRVSVSNPRWPSGGATRKRHDTQALHCPLNRGDSRRRYAKRRAGSHGDASQSPTEALYGALRAVTERFPGHRARAWRAVPT